MSKVSSLPSGACKVLDFYNSTLAIAGLGPSIEEIRRHFGWKSRTSVVQILKVLVRENILERGDGAKHRYRLVKPRDDNTGIRSIPIFKLKDWRPVNLKQNTDKKVLVDQRLLGGVRYRELYALTFDSAPPENCLIFTGREALIVTPWNRNISGQCWVLVRTKAKLSILFNPRIRGWNTLTPAPGSPKKLRVEDVKIFARIVGVLFNFTESTQTVRLKDPTPIVTEIVGDDG